MYIRPPLPPPCKVGQLILKSQLASTYPAQLCMEGGRGVLILKNFFVVAMDLDMSMLLSNGLKQENGLEISFYVLSGWLFFSQTPDSNFKLISIHLLQQQENMSCDFVSWIVPECLKNESSSCFVGTKKIDSLTSCVLCLWAPRWLVLL